MKKKFKLKKLIRVSELETGSFFGEKALMNSTVRNATIRVVSDEVIFGTLS